MNTTKSPDADKHWPTPKEVEENAPREDGSEGLPGYGQPPEELRRKMKPPEREVPHRKNETR
jgi:hypothetical protein